MRRHFLQRCRRTCQAPAKMAAAFDQPAAREAEKPARLRHDTATSHRRNIVHFCPPKEQRAHRTTHDCDRLIRRGAACLARLSRACNACATKKKRKTDTAAICAGQAFREGPARAHPLETIT
jgi:hypothetical protein